MAFSFAGGYFGFGYMNKKSDSYERMLIAESQVAMERI